MSLNIKTNNGYETLASTNKAAVWVNTKDMQRYSTEETVIGYWINGKPIYRKVFTNITLPICNTDETAGEKAIETEIENVDSIVSLHYIIRNTEESLEWQATNYAFNGDNANAGVKIYFCNYNPVYPNDVLVIRNAKTTYSNKPINIILEYTKTTDVAKPDLNINTYSTDELLTGETWIDGKPIYRKVFTAYTPSPDNINKTVIIIDKNDLSQIDYLVKLDGIIRGDLVGANAMLLNHCQNGPNATQYYSSVTYHPNLGIRQCIGTDAYSNVLEYIYLEYTKK